MSQHKLLLEYLRDKIYIHIPKKELKRIMAVGLGGELLEEIDKYKIEAVRKMRIQKDKVIKIQFDNLTKKDLRIKELEDKYEPREKTLAEKMGYGIGRYCGD